VYDLITVKKRKPSTSVYQFMREEMIGMMAKILFTISTNKRLIKIPVCYDLSFAPDLVSLAEQHQLTTDKVIQLHTGKNYRVFMIGFLPGFAYMGSVDEKINTPRLSKPRTLVPAGSVGIAGEQTGIYPFDSPGGWQLIGKTPVQMFSASRDLPCYLQPGDEVQFYPITLSEYENFANA
jgi:inhibitor of KinA